MIVNLFLELDKLPHFCSAPILGPPNVRIGSATRTWN